MSDEKDPKTSQDQDPDKDESKDEPATGEQTDYKAEMEKWKALSRKHEQTAKQNADAAKKLAEMEEAQKTAEQKAADKAAQAEKTAADANRETARLRVALRKGLTETQAKRLVGDTEEELEADADELLESFASKTADDGKEKGEKPGSGRPKEALKSGATKLDDEVAQLTRADLKTMTPAQINKAREEGRLRTLLEG